MSNIESRSKKKTVKLLFIQEPTTLAIMKFQWKYLHIFARQVYTVHYNIIGTK